MDVEMFGNYIGKLLYNKRFGPYFVECLVCGLSPSNKPEVFSYDSIGCITQSENFGCQGTGNIFMLGQCELYYRAKLQPRVLQEVVGNIILYGTNLDAYGGLGAFLYLLTPDQL